MTCCRRFTTPAKVGFITYLRLVTGALTRFAGDSGLKEYDARTTISKKSKDVTSAEDPHAPLKTQVRVYFPSQSTVRQSRGGRNVSDYPSPLP